MNEREVERITMITKDSPKGPPEVIDALPYSVRYESGGLKYTTNDGGLVFRPWHGIIEVESKIIEIGEGEGACDG